MAQQGPPGLTVPRLLPPFDANAAACTPPAGLARVLAFAQDNEREFMNGVARGLAAAARDRRLEFRLAQARNDGARQIEQVQQFRAARVGALVSAPVDAIALAPHLQQVIWSGAYVGSVVPPPATEILNAPQYLTGKALGDAAAAYIRDRLGGRASVVLLTHDSLQFLAPRFVGHARFAEGRAGRDHRGRPLAGDRQQGRRRGRDAHHPAGASQRRRRAGRRHGGAGRAGRAARRRQGAAEQFLGGIDGEPEAVAEIRRGGPYKASISLNSPVFAYALGQHAADWLEGRSIPQAMDILPSALSASNLAQYEADLADPAAVWRDVTRRNAYLRMYGNICHDTRDQYLNFPWSSERRPTEPVR